MSRKKSRTTRRPRHRRRLQRRRRRIGRKWAGDADAMHKHIIKFDKRQAKYDTLASKAKDKEKYSAAGLKIWCRVWKKCKDRVILPKAEKVRAYAMMLKH